MFFIDPRMSKLNIHVKRTVHFAHGYRKVGGREVEDKKNVSKVASFIISKDIRKPRNKNCLQLQ